MDSNQKLCHIVLIKYKDGTPQTTKDRVYALYQGLAEACGGREAGILYCAVRNNLDLRKGVELSELMFFEDNDALQRFRVHPKHGEITDILREVADWTVGDMLLPFPLVPLA